MIFVNVDICTTVLNAGESTDSAAIFIELLQCFCEVLLFLGCMCMSGDVSGAQLAGNRGKGGLPYPFLRNEKIALIIWKNALIVFIHRLNVHLCSNSKCYFKST